MTSPKNKKNNTSANIAKAGFLIAATALSQPAHAQMVQRSPGVYSQSFSGHDGLPYQPPAAKAPERTITYPPGMAPVGSGASVSPPPQQTVLSNPNMPYMRPNIPAAFNRPILPAPPAQPTTPYTYRPAPGSDRAPSAPDQTTISGIAPALDPQTLNTALEEPTGPSLPDASLGHHYQDGLLEGNMVRQTALINQQNTLETAYLTNLKNIQSIRIALAKTKMPIVVSADTAQQTDDSNSGPGQQAPSGYPAPPAGTSQTTLPSGGQPSPSSNTNDNQDENTAKPAPVLPVVYGITGDTGNMTAHILVPYSGYHDIHTGAHLPNNMVVTSINPNGVTVRLRGGAVQPLPWGESVDAVPPPPPVAKHAPTVIR